MLLENGLLSGYVKYTEHIFSASASEASFPFPQVHEPMGSFFSFRLQVWWITLIDFYIKSQAVATVENHPQG
jgi:hypothetical protein